MANVTKPIILDETGVRIAEALENLGLKTEEKSITKNGTYTPEGGKAFSKVTVNVGGGTPSTEPGVSFFDYDGAEVAFWPMDEVAEKTELPGNPDHSSDIVWGGKTAPLTSRGWKHSLADIQSFAETHPQNVLSVGQRYSADKIYLGVHIGLLKKVASALSIFSGSASIDWGDNSPPETYESEVPLTHEYAAEGDYLVTVTPSTGAEIEAFFNDYAYTSSLFYGDYPDVGRARIVWAEGARFLFLPDALTSIWDYAFVECEALQSLVLPDGLTSIGGYAFNYCYSLQSLVLPDSLTSIGNCAFYECHALQSLALPEGLTSIGDCAFQYCDALQSLALPEGLTSIGEWAFHSCYALQSLVLPDSLTSIGDGAFYSCNALQSLVLPDSLTSVGYEVFAGCNSLQSLVLPDTLTSIGGYAFAGCYVLQSLVLPDSLTSLGDSAFVGCYALQSLVLPDGLTSIGGNTFSCCNALQSLVLPDGLTSIGYRAFDECRALQSLVLPDGLTSIGDYAFEECYALQSLVLPDGLTSIEDYTFKNCWFLTEIEIPAAVEIIRDSAFCGCYETTRLRFYPPEPPRLYNVQGFDGLPTDCVIEVPAGSLDEYQSATNYPDPDVYTYVEF